jgi:hypothetical protein
MTCLSGSEVLNERRREAAVIEKPLEQKDAKIFWAGASRPLRSSVQCNQASGKDRSICRVMRHPNSFTLRLGTFLSMSHGLLPPIQVFRDLAAGRMSEEDVIHWAENVIAGGGELADNEFIMEIAWLPKDGRNNIDSMKSALERLVDKTADFSIDAAHIARSQDLARTLIARGELSSIHKDNCMEFVLGTCPGIAPHLERVRRFYREVEPGLFGEMRAFVDFVVRAIQNRAWSDLDSSAKCLEHLLVYGDRDVQGAATVGTLEGIEGRCVHPPSSLEPFSDRLGPRSKMALDDLAKFWAIVHEKKERGEI